MFIFYYRYDVRGRVKKMWNIISGFDTLLTEYEYNSQDQVTYLTYRPGKSDSKKFRYDYDYSGRLQDVSYFSSGDVDDPQGYYVNFSSYEYNTNSQMQRTLFHSSDMTNEYFYNNRNWITAVINSKGVFDYTNDYFKNGNVKKQTLTGNYKENFTRNDELTFIFTYDKSNRLLTSSLTGQTKNDYNLINSYDKDGNILTLDRYGSNENLIDDFNYTYYSGTNKLQRVSGAGNQFGYDLNGNLAQDYLNNNSEIVYDHRNLITELKHRSQILGDTVFLTKYYYDETGSRIRKMTYKYTGSLQDNPSIYSDVDNTSYWLLRNDEIYSRDISGKELAIYVNENIYQWNVWGLDNEGKIDNSGNPFFYLKDHLGSVRSITDANLGVVSSQDYDAWGYLLQGRQYDSDESVYKFTGKERDKESEYDYFGARYYDARVANWTSVDPLMEKHFDFSPYNYVLRNPMRLVDPDGMQVDFNTIIDITSSIIKGKVQNEILSNLSTDVKAEYYDMSLEEFSRGNIISSEIQPGDFLGAAIGVKLATKFPILATEKLIQQTVGGTISNTLENVTSTSTSLVGTELNLTAKDILAKMSSRGISEKMIKTTLAKGKRFWDPNNNSINYVLEKGFASGKDMLVGVNPLTRKIATTFKGKDLIHKRFIPF
ncbi:MAG: RHS repeat-associated core domain-containing protein [bacterium]|nr:RHS repeat-associated core domain-containing protein [bacterium]